MADHLKEGAVSESSEISFTNIYFWWGGGPLVRPSRARVGWQKESGV